MKGKMYKLTGTGMFNKAPIPKAQRGKQPVPKRGNAQPPGRAPKPDRK